jgi:hypothetical protein
MSIQCSNSHEFINRLSTDMATNLIANVNNKYSIGTEKTIKVSIQLNKSYYNITKCVLVNDFELKIKTKNNDIPLNLIEDIKKTITQARSHIGTCNFSVQTFKKIETVAVIGNPVNIAGDFNL